MNPKKWFYLLIYGLTFGLILWFLPWPTPPNALLLTPLLENSQSSSVCVPKPLGCVRYYHYALPKALPNDPVLYVTHFNGDIEVFWQEKRFYQSQRPALLNHNQTLWLPLPAESAEASPLLTIRLSTWGLLPIHLGAVALGEAPSLKPYYKWQFLFFETLPRLFLAFNFLFAVIFFWVFWKRRQETAYLFFALFLWLDFLSYLPLWLEWHYPVETLRLLQLLFIPKAIFLLFFALYFRGLKSVKQWQWLWLLPVVAYLSLWILPTLAFAWLAKILFIPLSLSSAIVALWLLIDPFKNNPKPLLRAIQFLFLLTLLLIIREGLIVYQLLSDNGMFLSRFSMMLGVTAVALFLMDQLIYALNRSDHFNQELQAKIQAAEQALKISFAREQATHKAMLLAKERERLTDDLHDGLAGQLLSIMVQCQQSQSDKQQIAQAARAALHDLRLVIDSLEDVGDDLMTMLATFHERLQRQLRGQSLKLTWEMQPLPPLPGLQPSVTLEIFRILQEAVNNVLRHAHARHLTITAALENSHIVIIVQDDGCGGMVMRPHGYGLRTMQKRAERLHANLTWHSNESGSWLKLTLPQSISIPLLS